MKRPDLIIIGGGSAGFYGALHADRLGARVALIEAAELGGTCPNRGCLPTKHLITAAEHYYYGQAYAFRGVEPRGSHLDFAALMEEKQAVVQTAVAEKRARIAATPGIRLIEERARLVAPDTVAVDGGRLSAPAILIATGSHPILPDIPGLPTHEVLTSDRVQTLKQLPRRLIVIGGGEIGLEYAQMLLHLGVEVTVLERTARLLPREEPEVSEALRRYLEDEGARIETGVEIEAVEPLSANHWRVRAQRSSEPLQNLEADALFVAVGRRPNTAGLGLEMVDLARRADGAVIVDRRYQTSLASIYAAGDVLGHERMLASLADREGELAVENAILGSDLTVDHVGLPYAILTSPQVASVGLKEAQARAAGYRLRAGRLELGRELPKATADRGLIKLVVDDESGRILGLSLLAPHAAEAIHEAIFIVNGRLTVEAVRDMVHVYPTVAEAFLRAADEYIRA